MGEAAVRRVPCPVTGNIHVYITARNEYGYLQLAYRHTFPVQEFTTLSLDVRASEAGTVSIAPRSEDDRCEVWTAAEVTTGWTNVSINLADSCPNTTWLHGLTISHSSSNLDLGLDNILFE